jgi:hypothetical protein
VYELDVSMVGSEPEIWRRLVVPAEYTLGDLHVVLQCAFDWQNCHLHLFQTRSGRRFGPAAPAEMADIDDDLFDQDEEDVTLRDVAGELKKKVAYEYDFGDSWVHAVRLVKTHPAGAFKGLPACLAGENAAPPEDCGGIYGYYDHLLEVLQDKNHPEHEDMLEWLGGPFDPSAFDLDALNKRLRRLTQR